MPRARLVALASLLPWGAVLALAAGAMAGCGSSSSSSPSHTTGGSDAGGSAGAGGAAGDAGTETGPVCGDGIVNGTEECDNGPKNAKGSGCEPDCKFSCHANSDCDDGNPCNGVETCKAIPGGRVCSSGPAPAENSACGTGGYCRNGVCTQPKCGNGIVEPGEDCEPPGTATCTANCKAVVCGDGVVAGNEQCDDGNTTNLDGCDSSCRYETQMRLTSFNITGDPAPPYCKYQGNAVGQSFSAEVTKAFDDNLQATIDGGTYNEFLTFGGLDDLTGMNAPSIDLGLISASPDPKYPNTWSPTALDQWYLADSNQVDTAGNPLEVFSPASITNGVLTAGPTSVHIHLVTGTTGSDFDLQGAGIGATIDTSSAPSTPAPPPTAGALASGLKVFESLDATGAGQGLCGAATVASLATTSLPQDFCLGPNACEPSTTCSNSRTYTYCGAGQPVGPNCNSLLDVLVGGCKVTALCVEAVTPTQPDVGTGGNAPAQLTVGANNKVTPVVPTDAFTFFAHFAALRAHLTNNLK